MTNTKCSMQTNLFKTMQFLRLQRALHLVENELYKNQPTPNAVDDGLVKRFFNSIGNEIKNDRTQRLLNKKTVIQNEYNRFTRHLNATTVTIFEENNIKQIIADIFSEDKYSLEKTMFSISVIFDSEFRYEYEAEGLAYISGLLWGKEDRLANMKSSIESIYKDLAKQPLSTEQKFILGGTAALMLFTATVPALAIGGLSASGITGGLAGFGTAIGLGGTMIEGIGLIALAELLLDGAIIGFTYALLDNHNKNVVKKSFREMNYNNAAQMLAIKCYIMHVAKQTMPATLFKEKTSELLQMISDLKSDTDYVLLVEGQNVVENKKKINVFHNLDNKLGKMLCV